MGFGDLLFSNNFQLSLSKSLFMVAHSITKLKALEGKFPSRYYNHQLKLAIQTHHIWHENEEGYDY